MSGGVGQAGTSPYGVATWCRDTAAASARPAEVLREQRWRHFPVSIIVLLSGGGSLRTPDMPPSASVSGREEESLCALD